ncbi:MAG: dynamin family protein [Polyangiaceae bacterium]|nr:dynamin family protein [Polyangiaceae bacterium]
MTYEAFDEGRARVTSALTEVAQLAGRVGAKSLGERIGRGVIGKLAEGRFHLVVVGEFNHGKSSFVNALLGASVLPIGVTPTTAVIHHVVHAPEPVAKIVRKDGAEPLDVADIKRLSAAEGATGEGIEYVELGWPSRLLEDRIVLVDTPGVNDLALQRADVTYRYIPQSDAVLFLLDGGQLLKDSERAFLQERILAKERDKVIFVVTKADLWSPDERAEAMAYVRQKLEVLVPSPTLFAVSAEQALAGHREQSGIAALEAHLRAYLPRERGRIVLDHAIGEGLAVASMLRHGVEARRAALKMSRDELDRRIELVSREADVTASTISARRAQIREEVAAIKAWAQRDLEVFVDDVVRELPAVVERSSSADLKLHLAAFLEAAFREWAQAESREISEALEGLAERTVTLVKGDTDASAARLSGALELTPPKLEVDTFAWDVGIFAVLTVGIGALFTNVLLGGILTVAAPLLALYLRGRVEAETKRRALELGPEALRSAAAQVAPKLDELISDFARQLDEWVVVTGSALYREMLEVLRAARAERAEGEAAAREAAAGLDARTTELDAATSALSSLRASLWVDRGEAASERPTSMR